MKLSRRELLAGFTGAALGAAPAPNRSYALLDPALLERSEGAHVVAGTAQKDAKALFAEDKPWEVRIDNVYANVLFHEADSSYKCWYSPFIQFRDRWDGKRWVRVDDGISREMGICYARSRDGVNWTKPELGLVEFNGNRRNNLIWRGPHGAGILLDRHEKDRSRRFKIFYNQPDAIGTHKPGERVMRVAVSADGLHWSEPLSCPEIEARGDTHNNAFWDARSSRYVGYTRLFLPDAQGRAQRTVGRTESPDFSHWTKAEPVLQGSVEHQTYAMPVFPHHQGYLGLVMIFHTIENTVDCELAWSHDTRTWQRIASGSALIPRGPQGAHDHGCIFAAAYPVARPDGIVLYYGGSDRGHNGPRKGFFCRARLRPDGYAGIAPISKNSPAALLTKPIEVTGRHLCVTADAAGGSARFRIAGARGFDSAPVVSDVTAAKVQDLSRFKGKRVQIQAELHSATLYTISFSD